MGGEWKEEVVGTVVMVLFRSVAIKVKGKGWKEVDSVEGRMEDGRRERVE